MIFIEPTNMCKKKTDQKQIYFLRMALIVLLKYIKFNRE